MTHGARDVLLSGQIQQQSCSSLCAEYAVISFFLFPVLDLYRDLYLFRQPRNLGMCFPRSKLYACRFSFLPWNAKCQRGIFLTDVEEVLGWCWWADLDGKGQGFSPNTDILKLNILTSQRRASSLRTRMKPFNFKGEWCLTRRED